MSELDDIRKALRAYQRAVTKHPQDVDLREQLAQFLYQLGYVAEAAKELALCAKLLGAQGRLADAIRVAKALIKIDPTRSDVLTFLARHYSSQGSGIARPIDAGNTASAPRPHSPTGVVAKPETAAEIHLSILTMDEDDALSDSFDEELFLSVSSDHLPAVPAPRPLGDDAFTRLSSDVIAITDELPRIPLLANLRSDAFIELVRGFEQRSVKASEVILKPAESTNTLFFVISGKPLATLVRYDGVRIELGEVEQGGFFGEFEILTGHVHNVEIRALEDGEILMMPRKALDQICIQYPSVRAELWSLYRKRLAQDLVANDPRFDGFLVDERKLLASQLEVVEIDALEPFVAAGDCNLIFVRDGSVLAPNGKLVDAGFSLAVGGGDQVRVSDVATVLVLRWDDLQRWCQTQPTLAESLVLT